MRINSRPRAYRRPPLRWGSPGPEKAKHAGACDDCGGCTRRRGPPVTPDRGPPHKPIGCGRRSGWASALQNLQLMSRARISNAAPRGSVAANEDRTTATRRASPSKAIRCAQNSMTEVRLSGRDNVLKREVRVGPACGACGQDRRGFCGKSWARQQRGSLRILQLDKK